VASEAVKKQMAQIPGGLVKYFALFFVSTITRKYMYVMMGYEYMLKFLYSIIESIIGGHLNSA